MVVVVAVEVYQTTGPKSGCCSGKRSMPSPLANLLPDSTTLGQAVTSNIPARDHRHIFTLTFHHHRYRQTGQYMRGEFVTMSPDQKRRSSAWRRPESDDRCVMCGVRCAVCGVRCSWHRHLAPLRRARHAASCDLRRSPARDILRIIPPRRRSPQRQAGSKRSPQQRHHHDALVTLHYS